MASLIDVNVLLAILHARHAHTRIAVEWLEGQADPGSIVICRVVQMAALRLLTRKTVMREDVVSPAAFWKGWDQLMLDDRFTLKAEPPGLEAAWREITAEFPAGKCAETDTYLAAFALSGDLTLVSFDQGFTQFPRIRTRLLT